MRKLPDRTKEKTPTASTAEVLDAKTKLLTERTKRMNSIAQHSTAPALAFSFDELELRVIMDDSEPLFVVPDVCRLLRVGNPTAAVRSLDPSEKRLIEYGSGLTFSKGSGEAKGRLTLNCVTESGFYTMILRCRDALKPGSWPHRVRLWATGEVLPSIRKTGSYSVKKQVPSDRQIKLAQSLVMSIERSQSKPCRDALIMLARSAFGDLRMELPDMSRLQPLQLPLVQEGGAV